MTLTWGCDEAQQVFERLEARCRGSLRSRPQAAAPADALARSETDQPPEAPALPIGAKTDESPE